jgi:predicted nucleic acid-binding Zn ribbon protein
MSDPPLRKCPDCGKSQLRRLVSASRFRLSGSGWYETDFKGNDETKRNLVEKAAAESTDSVTKSADSKKDAAGKDGAAAAPAPAAPAPAAEKAASPASEAKSKSAAKRKPKPRSRAAKSTRR